MPTEPKASMTPNEVAELHREIAALRAELEAAKRDTARLDWLSQNECAVGSHREKADDGWTIWWTVYIRARSLSGHPLPNPRAAIDAAMEADHD